MPFLLGKEKEPAPRRQANLRELMSLEMLSLSNCGVKWNSK